MRKYMQITLVPDEAFGITLPVLMSHVMQALHGLFVQMKDDQDTIPVGVSFPAYDEHKPSLGDKVRIHGRDDELVHLDVSGALSSLQDYVHATSPRVIPEARQKGYVAYSRLRHDHGKEKLIRRRMKRHGLSREKAEQDYADYQQEFFPNCPFVMMCSASTGNNFYPLYIKRFFLGSPGEDRFNTFGINPSAGVEQFD